MPYTWTAERERRMLLLAISSANLRPSAETWAHVANLLGEGLSASAVSQKYYKLKNESARLVEGQPVSAPATPIKRKAGSEEIEEKKYTPPSKRTRKTKREPLDGIPLSDLSDNSRKEAKPEEMAAASFAHFPGSVGPMMATTDYWIPINPDGQVKGDEAGNSIFTA